MKLGILGGSFNPIHVGHLVIADRAAETLGLDQVHLIPTWSTPLKSTRELAHPQDRLHMVRTAVRGNPKLRADNIEVRRGGVSYTVETVRALHRKHGKIFLIIGTDSLSRLSEWKEIRELARLCTFAVAGRPSVSVGKSKADRPQMPKYIVYRRVPGPLLEISSSEIRDRIRKGLSIRYLIPQGVENFIRRKGLYGRC